MTWCTHSVSVQPGVGSSQHQRNTLCASSSSSTHTFSFQTLLPCWRIIIRPNQQSAPAGIKEQKASRRKDSRDETLLMFSRENSRAELRPARKHLSYQMKCPVLVDKQLIKDRNSGFLACFLHFCKNGEWSKNWWVFRSFCCSQSHQLMAMTASAAGGSWRHLHIQHKLFFSLTLHTNRTTAVSATSCSEVDIDKVNLL